MTFSAVIQVLYSSALDCLAQEPEKKVENAPTTEKKEGYEQIWVFDRSYKRK